MFNLFKKALPCKHEVKTIEREVPNIFPHSAMTKVWRCNDCNKLQTELWVDGKFMAIFSPF